MGFFSGKRIIRVASVVYNLAGDVAKRPSYLKTLVVRNVLSGTKDSIAETLTYGHLHGPGIQLRQFYRWSKRPGNYEAIGPSSGSIGGSAYLDPDEIVETLREVVRPAPDEELWVYEARSGDADISYWAEAWILENRPEEIERDWLAEADEENQVTITFEDGSVASFPADGFRPGALYVYASYELVRTDTSAPLVRGETVLLGSEPPQPPAGWDRLEEEGYREERTADLATVTRVHRKVTRSYADGRPDEVEESDDDPVVSVRTEAYVRSEAVWTRDVYQGGTTEQTTSRETLHQYVDSRETILTDVSTETTVTQEGDATVTTVVTTRTEGESLVGDNSERTDTREILLRGYSGKRMLIYRVGSGQPALDKLVFEPEVLGEFFPFIPFRIYNQFLSDTYQKPAYEQAKKAYKKLTGQKLDVLIDKVADNESLKDIDYAYVVPAVSLNVLDRSCRRYVYEFFDLLRRKQLTKDAEYEAWESQYADAEQGDATWFDWYLAQRDPENPLHGAPEPPRKLFAQAGRNSIRITNVGPLISNLDMRIQWNHVLRGEGTGLGKPGAKQNELWFVTVKAGVPGGEGRHGEMAGAGGVIRLYWQTKVDRENPERSTYQWLEVIGLVHHNFIYARYEIATSAAEALADPEESGFIVPIHYETLRAMPLVHSTQVATQACQLIFNCYTVKKRKWYENAFFQVIAVVVLAAVFAVATGGAGIGLLGSALTVGTALGFTGTVAIAVGAAVNALASIVLVSIIEKVATEIFGPVIGQIIAVIAVIAIGNVSSTYQTTGNLALDWGSLMKADNLLALTNSVGNAWVKSIQLDTLDIQNKAEEFAKRAEREAADIQQRFLEEFGYGGALFDPMLLTQGDAYVAEAASSFLQRTLLTGSDIAELDHDMLSGFARYTTKLPDAFT